MSTVYSGDDSADVTGITIPSDGDAATVTSVNPAFEGLMNKACYILTGATAFEGNKSFANNIQIDGLLSVDGLANEEIPTFSSATAPTVRRLLAQFLVSADIAIRFYLCSSSSGHTIGLEATLNASWDTGPDEWSADDDSKPAKILELFSGPTSSTFAGDDSPLVIRRKQTTSSAWNGNAWDNTAVGLGIGHPDTVGTNDITQKNVMYTAAIPIAWGTVDTDGVGGVTLSKSYNVQAKAIVGDSVRITLEKTMADTDYTVQVTSKNFGSPLACTEQSTMSTTVFDIGWFNASFVQYDAGAVSLGASFVVFGEVA